MAPANLREPYIEAESKASEEAAKERQVESGGDKKSEVSKSVVANLPQRNIEAERGPIL